jgi:hypothetical protein
MGKRAIDLPDPLEQPGQTPAPAPADDLISELAGEQIERLISSGENDKTGERRPNSQAKQEPERPATPPPSADSEAAWGRADFAAHSVVNAHSEVGAQLDELFKAIHQSPKTPPPQTLKKQPPPISPFSSARTAAQDDDELLEYVNARLGGHPQPPHDIAVAKPPDKPANGNPDQPAQDAPPVKVLDIAPKVDATPKWLKVLEAINAPFVGLSDSRRAALGKAAIITLLNGIAVLIYVLVFR